MKYNIRAIGPAPWREVRLWEFLSYFFGSLRLERSGREIQFYFDPE